MLLKVGSKQSKKGGGGGSITKLVNYWAAVLLEQPKALLLNFIGNTGIVWRGNPERKLFFFLSFCRRKKFM